MNTAVISHPTTGAAAGFGLIMSPQTLTEVKSFCDMLAKTDFVPKAFRQKPDSIMVVGAMGARLGVDVFSAMAGIADINGRPSIYGDLMLAVCSHHPLFEDCIETFEGKAYDDNFTAICVAKRKGREPVRRSFSVQEAKEANLWKKAGPWSQTPQRMLQMRARAFALRDTFADALAGFHSREEMEDSEAIDVTASATVRTEVKPARTRTTKTIESAAQPEASGASSGEGGVAAPAEGEAAVSTAGSAGEQPQPKEEPKQEGPAPTALDKAMAMEPATCSIEFIRSRCLDLTKPSLKHSAAMMKTIKDQNARWKIENIQALGGASPADRQAYLIELEKTVAEWSKMNAGGVAL